MWCNHSLATAPFIFSADHLKYWQQKVVWRLRTVFVNLWSMVIGWVMSRACKYCSGMQQLYGIWHANSQIYQPQSEWELKSLQTTQVSECCGSGHVRVCSCVRVDYQPEGGSLVMYTVDNATATSATLSNLQCNTQYTISVYAEGGRTGRRSVTRVVFLPARGTTVDQVF